MHHAAQKRNGRVRPGRWRGAWPGERGTRLGRRDSRAPRLRRQEGGLFHAQRVEQLGLRVAVEPFTAHPAHDIAEQKEVDVAVDEAFARRRGRHLLGRPANGFLGAVKLDLELEIGPQPRCVRQQLANGDGALAVAPELGDELRDRIGQANPPLLHQLHHAGGRRHDFGQGGQIEDRVFGHRLLNRPDRAPAERPVIHDRVAAADQDDGAGQFVARDGGLDDRRNRRETGARFDRRRGRLGGQSGHRNEGRQHARGEGVFHGIQYILNLYRGF